MNFDQIFEAAAESPEIHTIQQGEFNQKTKALLKDIYDLWCNCWVKPSDSDIEESEDCGTCNGMLMICQGGVADIDCPHCDGTGKRIEPIFDSAGFNENMIDFIFGQSPFLELMECDIAKMEVEK